MLNTNIDKIVVQSVEGVVHHPVVRLADTRISHDGTAFALPTVGGICYNVTVGDSAFGWAGDHIEPDVSIKNFDMQQDKALNFLACIGNSARVVTGDAKGKKGFVIGKHGGIEHVIVWFDKATKQNLKHCDSILIEAAGQGLVLFDAPSVNAKNIDAKLLENIICSIKQGVVTANVVAKIPAHLLGSGIGYLSSNSGDVDLQTADFEQIKKYNLQNLRLGDVVYVSDFDSNFGRGYKKNAATVGIVVHTDCFAAGHGPGITTVLCGTTATLKFHKTPNANISNYLKLG